MRSSARSCQRAAEDGCARMSAERIRRDRSGSASRSVRFRREIGRTPCRDRSYYRCEVVVCQNIWDRLHASGVLVPRWDGSQGWGRMSRATPSRADSADTRTCPERSIVHIRVHSASVEIAESCGTAISVAAMVLLPCAQTPLPHMGARPPYATIARKARHSNKNRLPPCGGPGLLCAISRQPTPARHTHYAPH